MSVANPSRDDFASMLEEAFSSGHSGEGQVVRGIITAIEAQLSAYAPDGDLSYVPDMLSVWAQWQGDADDFAATFIKAVADNECRMRSWIERNEASRKAAENNRQRQQRHRTKQSAPRTAPDNG